MTSSGASGRSWVLVVLSALLMGTAGTGVVTAVVREWPHSTGFDQVSVGPADAPTESAMPSSLPTVDPTQGTTTPTPDPVDSPAPGPEGQDGSGTTSSFPLAGECVGPLPPGHHAVPACDALHPHDGIPEDNCITPTNACAWPDAWGAVLDQPDWLRATVTGRDEVTLRWHAYDHGGNESEGPLRQFVVRIWVNGTWHEVRRVYVAPSETSVIVKGLDPGSYLCEVQSVNDSGVSPGSTDTANIDGPTDNSPTPSPSPSPSKATPTPTPTTTATPTPAV